MEVATAFSPLSTKPAAFVFSNPITAPTFILHYPANGPRLSPLHALNTDDSESVGGGSSSSNDANQSQTPSPPQAVEIRIRRGSRKRAKQQQQDVSSSSLSATTRVPPAPPKVWDSMTLGEKAGELYMGEKGLLFWLNKFAYASIFVVVGGWILFRFVGPSLGLYQLESSPLSPSTMFDSSS